MKTVYFHNPGNLDIRGAYIAGLSAKADDKAIGKFGTGLKYAIASILRWGGAVTIETGGEIYEFSKNPIDFRGKAHDQVVMRKRGTGEFKELGFTTHYGEQGGVSADMGRPSGSGTVITVDCKKVAECFAERDTIILPQKGTPTQDCSGYDTHLIKCPSSFLYYRNVRVRKQKCLFTWNLMDCITLTEDRSLENTWDYDSAVCAAIQFSKDQEFIGKALRAGDAYFEGGLNYSLYYDTSPEFIAAATWMYKQEGRGKLPAGVWQILCKHTPDIDVPEVVQLTKVQQSQLDRAIELVARMGLDSNVPIHVVKLQKNTLGLAKNGQVYLSPQVFEQGTKQIVSTLFEECLHLETGLKDCTYEMQTRLFNMIVSLYEEHVFGEAC
jgi:hypothetical protein